MRFILIAFALLAFAGCDEEDKLASIEERCENARNDEAPACEALGDCPRLECLCNDGTIVTSRSCASGMCVTQSVQCADSCSEMNGWACGAQPVSSE